LLLVKHAKKQVQTPLLQLVKKVQNHQKHKRLIAKEQMDAIINGESNFKFAIFSPYQLNAASIGNFVKFDLEDSRHMVYRSVDGYSWTDIAHDIKNGLIKIKNGLLCAMVLKEGSRPSDN
jgi:hypothetical protein